MSDRTGCLRCISRQRDGARGTLHSRGVELGFAVCGERAVSTERWPMPSAPRTCLFDCGLLLKMQAANRHQLAQRVSQAVRERHGVACYF